jgi:hypothetical protein
VQDAVEFCERRMNVRYIFEYLSHNGHIEKIIRKGKFRGVTVSEIHPGLMRTMSCGYREQRLANIDAAYLARYSNPVCDGRREETRSRSDIQHSPAGLKMKSLHDLLSLSYHIWGYIHRDEPF